MSVRLKVGQRKRRERRNNGRDPSRVNGCDSVSEIRTQGGAGEHSSEEGVVRIDVKLAMHLRTGAGDLDVRQRQTPRVEENGVNLRVAPQIKVSTRTAGQRSTHLSKLMVQVY